MVATAAVLFGVVFESMGVQINRLQVKATGDLKEAFEELAMKQAQLMAELEAIGGENEEWDAAAVREAALDLRAQLRSLAITGKK
jgi:hypothetical protein